MLLVQYEEKIRPSDNRRSALFKCPTWHRRCWSGGAFGPRETTRPPSRWIISWLWSYLKSQRSAAFGTRVSLLASAACLVVDGGPSQRTTWDSPRNIAGENCTPISLLISRSTRWFEQLWWALDSCIQLSVNFIRFVESDDGLDEDNRPCLGCPEHYSSSSI